MINNYPIYHFSNCLRGFAPSPTSFFVLIQRTKQEKSSQNNSQHALLQDSNFRQSGQASLPKFHALQHYSPCLLILKVFMNSFASSHPNKPRVLARPPHGTLIILCHSACRAKQIIPCSDGLPFKRRRQPECVQTVSLLGLLSVTTESDRKKKTII
jgi:hypothetical protein